MDGNTTINNCLNSGYFVYNLSEESAAVNRMWSGTEDIFISIGLPIVMFVGSVGNFAFLFAIFRVKAMQTITNAYLANVAIADSMLVNIACPMYIIAYIKTPFRNSVYFQNWIGCVGSFGASYFGYLASLLLITIVSAERYYAICRPFQHRMIAGKKHTIQMITFSWVLAFILVSLVMPEYAYFKKECVIWPDDEQYDNFPQYVYFCDPLSDQLFILGELALTGPFFIVLPANLYMYISIIITLNNRPGTKSSSADDQQQKSARNQVAFLLITNGTVFFLCQAPYRFVSVHLILRQITGEGFLSESVYGISLLVGRFMTLINAICNPFIYLITSSFYRRSFREAFFGRKLKKKKTELTTTLSIIA